MKKNNNLHNIDKAYVSEHDKFLQTWDKKHQLSESQRKEIAKYKQIFELRDGER